MSETIELRGFKTCTKALSEPDLRQSLYDAGAILMKDVLVNLHGDEHRQRRILEMGVFRRNFFKYYELEIIPGIIEKTLQPFLARGEADVIDFGRRVMVHLSLAFAGIDPQDHSDEEFEALLDILNNFGHAATLGQAKGDREALRKKVEETLTMFEERFYNPSRQLRLNMIDKTKTGELSEDDLPRDILTVLLHKGHETGLSKDVIMKEAAFFYLAGGHTSVHSLGHIMHHLLTWCEKHPADRKKLETDIHLLQRFAHESFRLHPSSPIAKRRALNEVTFEDGQTAATGDTVVVNLRAANRDTEVFGDDSADFNPFRTLPPGVNETGITFGVGIHSCLGRNLAAGSFDRSGKQVDPENHQFGTVARVAHALLVNGAKKHPTKIGQLDQTIERETWQEYPIVFEG